MNTTTPVAYSLIHRRTWTMMFGEVSSWLIRVSHKRKDKVLFTESYFKKASQRGGWRNEIHFRCYPEDNRCGWSGLCSCRELRRSVHGDEVRVSAQQTV